MNLLMQIIKETKERKNEKASYNTMI